MAALARLLGAEVIFHGRVTDTERRTIGGLARGTAILSGLEGGREATLKIDFQNEFLIAERDGKVLW